MVNANHALLPRPLQFFALIYIALLVESYTTNAINQEKKIAFLFLSYDQLPLEPIWRRFFEGKDKSNDLAHYTIYNHPSPNFTFPATSFFYGKEVKNRVITKWAEWSLVTAEVSLLTAALEDPLNEWFCLISDSCIPLVSFKRWREAFIPESRSVINACPYDPTEMSIRRWKSHLGSDRSYWRKSGQFFVLTRKHAMIIVEEASRLHSRWLNASAPDETFMASVIASYRLENETTCSDGFTTAKWIGNQRRPYAYGRKEINTDLLHNLSISGAQHGRGFYKQCSGYKICHFTARKFAADTTDVLMQHMDNLLYE